VIQHFSSLRFVNRLTSPLRDHLARTPEYKVAAVRVEKLAG
jgi:predicted molibdopterin-dependent oxidoreductase YjgC